MSAPHISRIIEASIEVKKAMLNDNDLLSRISKVTTMITDAFQSGSKVLFCGNGGSAADAQHLAAEFSGRFYTDRHPLPSEALHCNTSYLTAVANDYGYEQVYSRLLRGIGKKGDVLISLSTSGNSKNILQAMQVARELGITNVAFTGAGGGMMKEYADYLIDVPSQDTPRIQEAHITIGHAICEETEKKLFTATIV